MEVTVHSTLHSAQGRVTVATDPGQTVDSLISAFCIEKGIPHRKEFVLRNAAQEVLNNTKRISASGIANGDVLFLGVKAQSESWACGCNQWWLLAGVALLIGAAGIVAITVLKITGGKPVYNYGVVIDCGSSHTQLYVYQWEGGKDNGTAIVKEAGNSCEAEGGGISSYAANPDLAGESLKPCLKEAEALVPTSKQSSSPIYLGATAGMRLLRKVNASSSDAIMASVRATISETSFMFSDPTTQARIIEGKEEGAFSWITANYLSGAFGHLSPIPYFLLSSNTYGAMDLGGASTQMTFQPDKSVSLPPEYQETLVLYGSTYKVYTHSYQCYGINEAHRRYLAHLVTSANFNTTILDPCLPKNNGTALKYDEIFKDPCTPPVNTSAKNLTFSFIGSSDSNECANQVRSIFKFNDSCPSCTFDNVYQPDLNGNYFAFSGFYYVMEFLNLTNQGRPFTLKQFEDAMNKYCVKSWEEVKEIPNTKLSLLSLYCFEAHFIHTLTVEGYGFNESSWPSLSFQKQIAGAVLGWSVGYMLNASNALPPDYPKQRISTVLFILLIILFIGFLFLSLGFIFHAKRVRNREPSQYERMTSYGAI